MRQVVCERKFALYLASQKATLNNELQHLSLETSKIPFHACPLHDTYLCIIHNDFRDKPHNNASRHYLVISKPSEKVQRVNILSSCHMYFPCCQAQQNRINVKNMKLTVKLQSS